MVEKINSFKDVIVRLGGTETDAEYLERVGHALFAVGKPPLGTEIEVTLGIALPFDNAPSHETVLYEEGSKSIESHINVEDSIPRILSATQAAQQIQVSQTTISRAIQNGWLNGEKIGRQYFVSEADLTAYQKNIASLRGKPGPKSQKNQPTE